MIISFIDKPVPAPAGGILCQSPQRMQNAFLPRNRSRPVVPVRYLQVVIFILRVNVFVKQANGVRCLPRREDRHIPGVMSIPSEMFIGSGITAEGLIYYPDATAVAPEMHLSSPAGVAQHAIPGSVMYNL